MTTEKSLRPRSDLIQKTEAFRRAAKVLRGASQKVTRNTIAAQASKYVPETKQVLLNILSTMSEEEFTTLVATGPMVGAEHPVLPARSTRPLQSGGWYLNRKRSTP